MNKRIRKKKHLGEFKELGFEISANLRSGLTFDSLDALMDRLITLAEARHLEFGGGMSTDRLFGFVTRAESGSATDDDRAAIIAFLEGDADVAEAKVAELRDAWHNWKD